MYSYSSCTVYRRGSASGNAPKPQAACPKTRIDGCSMGVTVLFDSCVLTVVTCVELVRACVHTPLSSCLAQLLSHPPVLSPVMEHGPSRVCGLWAHCGAYTCTVFGTSTLVSSFHPRRASPLHLTKHSQSYSQPRGKARGREPGPKVGDPPIAALQARPAQAASPSIRSVPLSRWRLRPPSARASPSKSRVSHVRSAPDLHAVSAAKMPSSGGGGLALLNSWPVCQPLRNVLG